MADYLPEDVIVKILGRLPIKSLIRFTCVSKRWRFIILSDSHFAKSQFQIACEQQTLNRRLLLSAAADESKFESVDSEETVLPFGDNSTVSKLRCPFQQPGQFVRLLSSCNGLVCALLFSQNYQKPWKTYIWNPSTRFFKKLPLIPSTTNYTLLYYGFGHFSAIDEYKVVIAKAKLIHGEEDEKETQAHIFSSKAEIWRRTESPDPLYCDIRHKGTLSNEALHWISEGLDREIVAFDIAAEKFRTMPLPDDHGSYFRGLGVFGGCLCAFDDEKACTTGFIHLWVMKEYDVVDSWTKLFTLKVSNQPEDIIYLMPIMVMETSTILEKVTSSRDRGTEFKLIRSGHKEEKLETHMIGRNSRGNMIEYEESTLVWLVASLLQPCPVFFIHWNCFTSHQ